MLEEYERAPKLGRTTNVLGGLVAAATLGRTARIGTPPTNWRGCSHQRVELAAELKFEEPVKVVHLY